MSEPAPTPQPRPVLPYAVPGVRRNRRRLLYLTSAACLALFLLVATGSVLRNRAARRAEDAATRQMLQMQAQRGAAATRP
jgi:hypothetical protein